MTQATLRNLKFLHPKYWPTWVGIGLIRSICFLPLRARWQFGTALGWIGYLLARRRRAIVETNIKLCFPELDESGQTQLVKDNFKSSGISIVETALAWFVSADKFKHLVDIEGIDDLTKAKSEGHGVLLLGMHLSSLDFCGAVLGRVEPFDVMYRRNKNQLLEAVMTRGRQRNFDSAIERDDVRSVIRRLKQGAIVWYGPDQDYGRKHSVFSSFFGVEAATLTATARIVKITRSPIVVFSHFRDLETGRYRISLQRLTQPYPTGDDVSDGQLINDIVETAVRESPEQYWWLHRRFKTRPEGEDKLY